MSDQLHILIITSLNKQAAIKKFSQNNKLYIVNDKLSVKKQGKNLLFFISIAKKINFEG
jgi:hypothetical protein